MNDRLQDSLQRLSSLLQLMSEGEKVTELTKQSAPTAKAPVVPQVETERWVGMRIMHDYFDLIVI